MADQQDMARQNRAAALDLIRRHGGMSRTQLAQRLELSAAAMTKIAAELMDLGLVAQEPVLDLSPSQPRAMLRPNPDWACVVTLSLTYNLAVGIVDFAGKLVHSERVAGDDYDHEVYRDRFDDLALDAVHRMLDRLLGRRVLGVGVLSYGCVDKDGVIRANSSLPRPNLRMADLLASVTRLPVTVDEEFRLLLMAHLWSSDQPAQNVVAMSAKLFGAGGGQAMLASGRIHYGAGGFAGQPGWAAPMLHGHDVARRLDAEVMDMGGKAAYLSRVREGDPRALAMYRVAVENYGYRVAHAANFINPELILLFTDYVEIGQPFLDQVREVASQHTPPTNLEGLNIQFGGRRADEERLAAAALPILSRAYVDGLFEAPVPAAVQRPLRATS